MPSLLDELESLLIDWQAGTLDSAGVERVREILRNSESAREFYLQQQLLDTALKLHFETGNDSGNHSTRIHAESSKDREQKAVSSIDSFGSRTPAKTAGLWWAATALIFAGLLVGRLVYLERNQRSGDLQNQGVASREAEPTAQGVAMVTRLVDVDWGEEQSPVEVGDALSVGRFSMKSGFAQVEFFCGATVVIEGPAELELQSPLLASVIRGKLRAQVPPAARGFTLKSRELKVVDLGTEFAMEVSDTEAGVHVFDGEVELHRDSSLHQRLTAGKAITQLSDGSTRSTSARPDDFIDIATLENQQQGVRNRRYEHWKNWSNQFRSDNRLIAYYAFDAEKNWNRRLNCSLSSENPELDGAIVGAKRVPGRWNDKGALEFKRPGDRVRVHIPGEYHSLTLACWVKIDSLDRWYNSLFLTDHYDQGEPHWQILDSGQLFFSVRHKPDNAEGELAKKKTHHVVLSPPFWKPELSGRWLHLATVYDADAGAVHHYLNGRKIHSEKMAPELVVSTTRIGAASIGNWSVPTRTEARFAIRNLNGSVGEFALFSAPLSDHEIKEIYLNGKP